MSIFHCAFHQILSQRSDPSSPASYKCHWSFWGDSAPSEMVHILKIKPVKATLAFTSCWITLQREAFVKLLPSVFEHISLPQAVPRMGRKPKDAGSAPAQAQEGLRREWKGTSLPCARKEKGWAPNGQRESGAGPSRTVGMGAGGTRECKGQNLGLAGWQQSLRLWQGSQETILAERGWERKEDRKGLIIQSWLTVA